MRYLDYGCEKMTNVAIKCSYHFYYLMLIQIFPGLYTKIFHILHKLDEISEFQSPISILTRPVYITFEHIIKLNTQPKKKHEFLHVYICFWYTFLTQKVNLTKGENSQTSYLHHERGGGGGPVSGCMTFPDF